MPDYSREDIDAVNAHATSTKVGDKVEADALAQYFRQKCSAGIGEQIADWAMPWAHPAPLKPFWPWKG